LAGKRLNLREVCEAALRPFFPLDRSVLSVSSTFTESSKSYFKWNRQLVFRVLLVIGKTLQVLNRRLTLEIKNNAEKRAEKMLAGNDAGLDIISSASG